MTPNLINEVSERELAGQALSMIGTWLALETRYPFADKDLNSRQGCVVRQDAAAA